MKHPFPSPLLCGLLLMTLAACSLESSTNPVLGDASVALSAPSPDNPANGSPEANTTPNFTENSAQRTTAFDIIDRINTQVASVGSGSLATNANFKFDRPIHPHPYIVDAHDSVYAYDILPLGHPYSYWSHSLPNFATLQFLATDTIFHPVPPHRPAYTRYDAQGIRRILVRQLTPHSNTHTGQNRIYLNPTGQMTPPGQPFEHLTDDMDFFSIMEAGKTPTSGEGCWNNDPSQPLFASTNRDEIVVYKSKHHPTVMVRSTYTNLGWMLEFNQPVCLTLVSPYALNDHFYISTAL